MSNSACCSLNKEEVVILGGGTNQGFSKEVY
jgi:Galactose oxidase, central domain